TKATLVALNKKNGEVIWKAAVPDGEAAYSSVIVAETGGVKQYCQLLGRGVGGVAAKDRKLLWDYDKMAKPTNKPTPIFHDSCVFSSYMGPRGGGNILLRLSADGDGVAAKEVYSGKILGNHHGGVVLVGDSVYGTTQSGLVCLDFKTGEKKWEE